MDSQTAEQSKTGQYLGWCMALLLGILVVGILCLVQLMDIADALGA